MKTTWVLILMLGAMLGSASGQTIMWVSDAHDTDAAVTGPDDQGWVDFLTSLGFNVLYPKGASAGTGYFINLDAAKIDELNAVDLIIMSRDVSSGGYSTSPIAERAQWGGLTKPLIMMSQYLARSSTGQWFNTTSLTARNPYYRLRAVDPEDPLFDNVLFDNDNETVWHDANVWPGYSSFVNTQNAGNGRVLAVRPDNGNILIAEWDTGVAFYNGSEATTGGPRMFFSGGTQEESGTAGRWGAYNLNAAGEQIFVNALKRYLGDFYYNAAPQVNAGLDQTVNIDGGIASAQLSAAVQDDGNPYGALLYEWRLLGGPAPVVFSDRGAADTAVQFTARGAYEFQVTVYDYDPNNPEHETGKTAADSVRVRVKNPAVDDVLYGHWAFEEGAGKTANDSAGLNDAGTLGSNLGVWDPNWVPGWVGSYALEFYGDSYVQIADATSVDPNLPPLQWEITTAAWIKVNEWTNVWASIIGKWNTTWRFARQNNTDHVTLHLSGVQESMTGTTNVNDGYWHHVAATYNGNEVVLYVDGRVDNTMAVSGPINFDADPTHYISIGNRLDNAPNRGWNGLIDDVRLYTYAISQDDVTDLALMGQNVIPNIDAGPDLEISLTYTDSLTIDAVGADLNDDVLSYEWTVAGPADVQFIPNANVEKPTVKFTEQGVYTFRVAVNDNIAGLEGDIFDEVIVTATRPSCADIVAQGLVLATDLNHDCYVDLQDLAIIAADWVRCYDPQQPDCENPFLWE